MTDPHARRRRGLRAAGALLIATALSALSLGEPRAASLLNGDFEDGLTGWTEFTTGPNGTTGGVAVVLFDTNGNGIESDAARLNVGQQSFTGLPDDFQGGGLLQDVPFGGPGLLSLTADLATFKDPTPGISPNLDTNEAGLFELLVDGIIAASFDFGFVLADQAHRGVLAAVGFVIPNAGPHVIAIQVTRRWKSDAFGGTPTPRQYIDNVQLSFDGPTVPEPSGVTLLGLGLLGLAAARRWTHAPYSHNGA